MKVASVELAVIKSLKHLMLGKKGESCIFTDTQTNTLTKN